MTINKLEEVLARKPKAIFRIGKPPKWMAQGFPNVKAGDEFLFDDWGITWKFRPKSFKHIRSKNRFTISLKHMTFVEYR